MALSITHAQAVVGRSMTSRCASNRRSIPSNNKMGQSPPLAVKINRGVNSRGVRISPSSGGIVCKTSRISASVSTSSSSSSSKRDYDELPRGARVGGGVFDPLFRIFDNRDDDNEDTSAGEKRVAPWWRASAAALAIAAVMLAAPLDAQAARSGGRMGGGSFRSAAPSMSRSYALSSSGSSSMGGMGRGGMGMGGGGYAVAPGSGVRTMAPMPSVIMPFGGFGYGFGPMMMFGGGGGLISMAFTAMFVLFFIDTIKNMFGGDSGVQLGGDRIAVVKIQIGLLGLARDLQLDLEKIADKADTSSPEGLHYVLEETVLALLRNPEYCVYGYATSDSARGPEEAEDLFNEFSMDERGKFAEETLVNVNSRKKASSAAGGGGDEDGGINEYILVTIIAAADGGVKLPPVTDGGELRTALKRVGAIRVDALQAVEVLWTPQEEGDTLTEDELLRDYPQLNIL